MTRCDTEDRVRLLRLAAQFIGTGNYWFRYHVQKMGEDADDLARRLFAFAAELEAGWGGRREQSRCRIGDFGCCCQRAS